VAEIQAVTFDVGGTLIKPWPGVGEIYARIARDYGANTVSAEVLDQRFSAEWRNQSHFNYSRDDWAILVKQVFDGVAEVRMETFFPALYEYFAKPAAWHVFDDVVPTLDRLAARGLKLAVISNWDERLRPLLQALGIERYFVAISVSSEIGFHKPSPVIFDYTARELGLRPGVILHVGDSHELDVVGAIDAGFNALELCRVEPQVEKGKQINSLMEIDLTLF
jgi:putative hydrolase of the HAD superfamily